MSSGAAVCGPVADKAPNHPQRRGQREDGRIDRSTMHATSGNMGRILAVARTPRRNSIRGNALPPPRHCNIFARQTNLRPPNPRPSAVPARSPPAKRGIPPEKRGVPPAKRDVPPEQWSIPPEEHDIPPDKRNIPPEECDAPPDKRIIPPDEQGIPPEKRDAYAAP